MIKASHTPGPWEILGLDSLAGLKFIEVVAGELGTSSFRSIAWVQANGEDEANAQLISAAPMMFEFIKDLLGASDGSVSERAREILEVIGTINGDE